MYAETQPDQPPTLLTEVDRFRGAGVLAQNQINDVSLGPCWGYDLPMFACASGGMIERIEAGRPLPPHLRGAVIALGNFDGFHLGHQAVVGRAVDLARERGVAAIVATFDPHPVQFFKPDAPPFRLTNLEQRQRLFGAAGADAMMVFAFSGALARVSPEMFVEQWLAGAGGVVTGADFKFGRSRTGNVRTLEELASKLELACAAVGPVALDGSVVSSSRVRAALKAGDCSMATRLLTRPFMIEGLVRAAGDDNGTCEGLHPAVGLGDYLLPRSGRYAVRVRTAGGLSHGVGYIDWRDEPHCDRIFLNFFDRDLALIGQIVQIELNARLGSSREGTYAERTDQTEVDLAEARMVFRLHAAAPVYSNTPFGSVGFMKPGLRDARVSRRDPPAR